MKRVFSVFSVALCAMAMMAQEPVITFAVTEHDFGKINEADGKVTTIFEFKNEGMAPLVLSNVRASCGCTTPSWTKAPVEPGQTGNITVTYNPNGRPGRFQKTITVSSNASEPSKKLYIKGEVIPKPAKPVNQYTVQMGDLSLKAKMLNAGSVKKGMPVTQEVEYANHTSKEITVALATSPEDTYLASQVTLATLKPNETGKFSFRIDTKACKTFGPLEAYAYVIVNNERKISDEFKLTIQADIEEDFSALTIEQRQQAPIMSTVSNIDFGVVAAGKKVKKSFYVQNAGSNPMFIRRVYSMHKCLTSIVPKGGIKSGKKGEVKMELNTVGMSAGAYSREIMVITNDPNQPRKNIKVTWTVQ